MSEYTEAQAQTDVDRLVAQLEADPSLRQAILEDPRRVLVTAGVPDETIDDVDAALAGSEVEGFAFEAGAPGLAVGLAGHVGHGGTMTPSTIVASTVSTYLPTTSISGRPSPG